jgi:hypothetical protein
LEHDLSCSDGIIPAYEHCCDASTPQRHRHGLFGLVVARVRSEQYSNIDSPSINGALGRLAHDEEW